MPVTTGIVIAGAGFAGIGMGIALKKAGYHDFVVLEKNGDLGGTWRDNTYPGCACDVPAPLYSYSFELNPSWTRLFAPQQEIWDYLRGCARKYGVDEHIRYGCPVERMDWDDEARRWQIAAGPGDGYQARAVVSAGGALHIPSYPDIPGTARFGGTAFHSSRWDHSADLTGRRVAVIGTGASAIQFVPEVAKQAAGLRCSSARRRGCIRGWKWSSRPGSAAHWRPRRWPPGRCGTPIYWMLEANALGFAVHPKLMGPLERLGRWHLENQVADPGLRAKLTPDYTAGCKRILLSSNYYPALQQPGVDLITDPITEITETGVMTADGTAHPADVIIYATGFRVIDSVAALNVTGRDGRDLKQEGVEAFHGVTVAGFPNFFMLLGPNTGLAHTSVVFMIETQIQHVMSCLRMLARDRADTIEVHQDALRRYNSGLQRRLRRAVWSEGGCTSWYLDQEGVNRVLWPGFSFEYWARTRRARRAAYAVSR